jgi:hypothetical protein
VSVLVLEALVDVSSWSSIWSAAAKTGSCALRWFNILCASPLSSSSLLSSEEEWYELWVSVLVLEALVDVSSWSSSCRAALFY